MPTASTNQQLSPQFGKAKKLSWILAALLKIGFWITAVFATALIGGMILSAIIWPLWPLPSDAVVSWHSPQIELASLSLWSKLGVAATFLIMFGPAIVALHFGQRVFAKFARGEVFASETVADIRAASLWVIAAACANSIINQFIFNAAVGLRAPHLDPNPMSLFSSLNIGILFFGLCTYIAGYVMTEAGRIASDNASFI